MIPFSLVRSLPSPRFLLSTILAIAIGVLTSWATLTGYTANRPANSKPPASSTKQPEPGRAKIDKNYGNLPLSFEANQGQSDVTSKFVARGPGYNIFLTPSEAVLVFQETGPEQKESEDGEAKRYDELSSSGPEPNPKGRAVLRGQNKEGRAAENKRTIVRMRLEGANPSARAIEGVDELPGKVNYFLGSDSSKWLTDIPTYGKVAYRDVYPGVGLIFYGNRQQLEYDLVVAPGADPSAIQIKFEGAESLRVDRQGNLLLKTAAGEIHQTKPTIYQDIAGTRKAVNGNYVLRPGNRIGFKVSRYDRSQPLLIDPILNYFSLANNSGFGYAIAVDAQGFAYITGATLDANLNPTPGAFQQTFGGLADIFVTKINPRGDTVLYSTYVGGSDDDEGYGIAVDSQGNAFVTGYGGAGYPVTAGAYQTTLAGALDTVITKLNPTGSGLIYSTFVGGSGFEEGEGIVLDSSGNAYVSGATGSVNFPITAGAAQSQAGGGYDAFVLSLNAAGSGLRYSTFLGGTALDLGLSIAIDSATNAYLAGTTRSLNFPTLNPVKGAGGTDRGLFKSVDSGSNWGLSRSGLNDSNIAALAIAPSAPATIYAGTTGTVYKSINSGATWTATALNTITVQAVAVDPTNSSVVYAGSTTGIHKTTDGGASWTLVYNSFSCSSLAIDPTTPSTIYAGVQNGIVKSTNSGGSWPQSLSSGLVRALAIDPTNPLIVYAGRTNGVSKTIDGGTNWNTTNSGLTNTNVRSFAISANAPATIYAGTLAGVFKSTNSGANWNAVNNGLLVPYTDNVSRLPAQVNALAIGSASALTVYAATTNSVIPTGAYGLSCIFKSTDGGANWTAVTSGFGTLNSGFLSLALDPNTTTLYAGNSGDVDGFVAKLNPAGSAFLFSSYLGSGRADNATGTAVDASGNQYVTGSAGGTDFPTTTGAYQTTLRGATDFFVTKISPSNTLSYSTYLGGGTVEDGIVGIGVDAAGNAYVSGRTNSTDFPVTAGAFQTTIGNPGNAANTDDTITKINPSGSALVYASYLGGSGNEPVFTLTVAAKRLAVDAAGTAYIVGVTDNRDGLPVFDYVNGGGSSTYIAKVDGTSASYSITGRLTTSTNIPIAGVSVDALVNGRFVRSVVSDSQGYYSLISLPPDDYVVRPNQFGLLGHYIWTPATRTFNGLNSDQTANFTGTQVYNIGGTINHSVLSGVPIFDVTVTLSGSASATTVTDANGNFFFRDLLPGSYTVTPTKTGFTFNPINRAFPNLSADEFTSFTTTSGSYFTLSGRVADAGSAAISNATVVMRLNPLAGTREASVQTDAAGNYSFANLQAGGNYAFMASKPLLTFNPQSQTFANLNANQTLNFTSSPVTGLIGKITFVRSASQTDISVMNADGSGETILTSAGGQCSGDSGPTWSPDGARIAFSKCDPNGNTEDLFLINADGSGLAPLNTNNQRQEVFPRWSPDGTHLTYTFGECSGSDLLVPDIFATDLTGSIRTRLTNNPNVDFFSDWSPNGSTIVFARSTNGDCDSADTSSDIYAMDSVGGNERRLTTLGGGAFASTYSPDGSKVAFSLKKYNPTTDVTTQNLFVMNADGSGQVKITPDTINADEPTWSPDGARIAFTGGLLGGGFEQIFVINADGTGLAQITSGSTERFFPSWQHYSISGRVTGNTTGVPITMTLAGTLTRVTRTDAAGNYVFGNLAPGGNYSVTPISTAFGFNPAKTDVNNLVGNQVANFAILPAVIPAPTPPLADDFAAAQRDPTKWNLGTQTQPLGAFDPQIPVVQQNGQLLVTPRSQTAGLHYSGYVALNSFDFNNAKATVEVAQPATNGAETIFAVGSDLDNFSRFVVRAGDGTTSAGKGRGPKDVSVPQLIFQVRVGGQLTSLSIPYDPVAHRFMRFRHEPPTNSIVFETSPNNVDFTVRHQVVLQKSVSALTAELSAGTSTATDPGTAVFDNFNLVTNTFQFSVTGFTVSESDGKAIVTVTRSGDLSTTASVDFSTFDETARQRNRYIPAVGTLTFAPGISTKTFGVLVEDNSLVEGSQTVSLRLLDSSGAGLNSPGRAVLTVNDNDNPPINTNPLDTPQFFVRQNYLDFLNRSPDQGGLDFWTGLITQCGSDQNCINLKRIDVSNAFYFELEFQQTGSYVYRLYRVAYGNNQPFPNPGPNSNFPGEDKKLLSYNAFINDRARVVGGPGLAQSQLNLANSFIRRAEFIATYPLSLDGPAFVDAVLSKMQTDIGVDLSSQRAGLITLFNSGGRGAVIYRLADDNLTTNPINNRPFIDAEYNRAFVVTQYFGYLRRNPDLGGFIFWLGQVNSGPLRDVNKQHAMVCSFVTSTEYQGRLSQAITHSNAECPH